MMPDIADYDDEDEWMADCVAAMMDEGRPQDQAIAACASMWDKRGVRGMGVELERRQIKARELRVVDAEGQRPRILGYGAVFNEWSDDLGGFRERIAPGAFAGSLQRDDIRSLFNHDPNHVLGRNLAGTLRLAEDAVGLALEVEPPDAQWAADLLASIRRGDISGMSFGFRTLRDEWMPVQAGPSERVLVEVALYDVGPVTFPAYPQTSVTVRQKAAELRAQSEAAGGDRAEEDRARAREDLRTRLTIREKAEV
jgi:HK97 family phage prohead protease